MSRPSPSSKRLRAKQCLGKRCYTDEADAWKSAYVATERAGEKIQGYLCPWCGRWHIGHKVTDRREGQGAWQREYVQWARTASELELFNETVSLFRRLLDKETTVRDTWKLSLVIAIMRGRLADTNDILTKN